MSKDIPAFPVIAGQIVYSHGITLRDYIALNASVDDICRHQEVYIHRESHGIFGRREYRNKYTREQARYRYADAMLAAREVKHEHD